MLFSSQVKYALQDILWEPAKLRSHSTLLWTQAIPNDCKSNADDLLRNEHGIPYRQFEEARNDFDNIWLEMNDFFIRDKQNLNIVSYDAECANEAIEWLRKRSSLKESEVDVLIKPNMVVGLGPFLSRFSKEITEEWTSNMLNVAQKSFDGKTKCKYHKAQRKFLKCARQDNYSIANAINKLTFSRFV